MATPFQISLLSRQNTVNAATAMINDLAHDDVAKVQLHNVLFGLTLDEQRQVAENLQVSNLLTTWSLGPGDKGIPPHWNAYYATDPRGSWAGKFFSQHLNKEAKSSPQTFTMELGPGGQAVFEGALRLFVKQNLSSFKAQNQRRKEFEFTADGVKLTIAQNALTDDVIILKDKLAKRLSIYIGEKQLLLVDSGKHLYWYNDSAKKTEPATPPTPWSAYTYPFGKSGMEAWVAYYSKKN